MDYTIIDERDKYSLAKEVLEHIKRGWIPQGGVATCAYGSEMHYTQAMIKEE